MGEINPFDTTEKQYFYIFGISAGGYLSLIERITVNDNTLEIKKIKEHIIYMFIQKHKLTRETFDKEYKILQEI